MTSGLLGEIGVDVDTHADNLSIAFKLRKDVVLVLRASSLGVFNKLGQVAKRHVETPFVVIGEAQCQDLRKCSHRPIMAGAADTSARREGRTSNG